MTDSDHILIVDDDPEIRRLLRAYLEEHGYRTTVLPDGRGLADAVRRSRPDLLILDLMLPGEDGLSLCRKLRSEGLELPIVMLTALGEPADRIVGLEMGADDYVAKPFEPRELLARIRVVLRRTRALPPDGQDPSVRRLLFAGWVLDLHARHLTAPDGVVVPLSGGELELLRAFLTHPNRVLSRDQLLDLTRGRETGPFDRSVDMQVGRLRRKLRDDAKEPQLIKTVRNAGYVLAATVKAER